MKQKMYLAMFLFCSFLLLPVPSQSQVSFSDQIIIEQTLTDGASSVHAADLDGDGDMDVLSTSWLEDRIAWYENTDGQGSFGIQQVISTAVVYGKYVYAADLDGDGDMDVLSGSYGDDKIAWYENIDGQGMFGPQIVITTAVDGLHPGHIADLDSDGDIDVLSVSYDDHKIDWYENTDGKGSFGPQQLITNTPSNWPMSVYAADLDSDSDMDVLSSGMLSWYENINGQGMFGSEQVIATEHVYYVCASDLDGDNDMDVLSADMTDDEVAWYENTDSRGTFGTKQVISDSAHTVRYVYTVDLDGDGDMDVISVLWLNESIVWYENIDGEGSFGSQQVITTSTLEPEWVFATDLDGDNDLDVLSASFKDDKIAWYRNLIPHVATPVFSPPPDAFITNVDVIISCTTPKATIFYTTDGSEPTKTASIYTDPINISTTTTFKARAYNPGMFPSEMTSGTYIISSNNPFIISITDIPNDEGKQVLIKWQRSILDESSNDTTITMYSLWRRVDNLKINNLTNDKIKYVNNHNDMLTDYSSATLNTSYLLGAESNSEISRLDLTSYDMWTFVGRVPAHQFDSYAQVAPTLFDSTKTGIIWSSFMVCAHADDPLIFFDSLPDSGYSVDNLSPSAPSRLMAKESGNGIKLCWNPNTEQDLECYKIYRDIIPNFELRKPIAFTSNATLTDTTFKNVEKYFYKITATDMSGNESEPSDEVSILITNIKSTLTRPIEYALFQNYPNPFNSETVIQYQLSKSGLVQLIIYNLLGEKIKEFINYHQNNGYHEVIWNGVDDKNNQVSSGIYLYQLTTNDFVRVRKMILIE